MIMILPEKFWSDEDGAIPMGNAVVGGMTFATMIGIFMIPVLFVVVERIFNRKKHSEE